MVEIKWLKVEPMRYRFKSGTHEHVGAPRELKATLRNIFEMIGSNKVWSDYERYSRVLADEVSEVIKDAVDYLLYRRIHMVVAEVVGDDGKTYILTNRSIMFIDDEDLPYNVFVNIVDMDHGRFYWIKSDLDAFEAIRTESFDEAVVRAAIAMKGDQVKKKIAEVLKSKGVDEQTAFDAAEKFVEYFENDPYVWTIYLATGDEALTKKAIQKLATSQNIYTENIFDPKFFKLLERFKYPFEKTLDFIRRFSIDSRMEGGVEYHLLKFKSRFATRYEHIWNVTYMLVAVDQKANKVTVEGNEARLFVLADYEDNIDNIFKQVLKEKGVQDLKMLFASDIVRYADEIMYYGKKPNLEHLKLLINSNAYKEDTAITEYNGYKIVFLLKGRYVLVIKDGHVGLTDIRTFLLETDPEAVKAKHPIIEALKERHPNLTKVITNTIISNPSVASLLPPETVAKMAELHTDLALP